MASFSDDFPDADIINALGDDVVYKQGTQEITLKATIDKVGPNSTVDELHTEVRLLRTALPFQPQRGDSITGNHNSYTVDAISIDDDNLYTLIVR